MRAMLLLGVLAGAAFAKDPLIEQAIEQLMRDDEDSGLAERVLKGLPDRMAVIEAAERALRGTETGIRAKRRVLLLASRVKRSDLVLKAIDSPAVSTRRAAAQLLAGMPELAQAVEPILVRWVAEVAQPDVALLVEACRKAKLGEAVNWLWTVAEAKDTPPEVFADAVAAVADHPSVGLAEFIKKRLADPMEDPKRIEACIEALKKLPYVNADDLLLPWLKQREHRIVRLKANMAIRDPAVHRQVVLDKDETNAVLQRQAFYRLMERLDDAALLELLRDSRVSRHRYFAIRVDVCTALACVEGSGAPDVPLLLDYLVDESPQDKQHIVRSEAWITLWTLTGKMHGAEGDFAKPPGRGGRECRATRMRLGVADEQCKVLERLAQDLDHMRTVQKAYTPE